MKKFIPKLDKIPFTSQGLDDLKRKKTRLLSDRPAAVKELQRARELGDLSENGLYKAARARLSGLDANLRRLEHLIKSADVQDVSTNGTVQIGSIVSVKIDGKQIEYHLVGEYEANPKLSKISQKSPIGKALIGRATGERVEIEAPNGKKLLEIVKVS